MRSLNRYIVHATKHSHQRKRRGCLFLACISYPRLLSTGASTCGRSTGERPCHHCMSLSHNSIMALLQKQWPAGFGRIVAAAEVIAQVWSLANMRDAARPCMTRISTDLLHTQLGLKACSCRPAQSQHLHLRSPKRSPTCNLAMTLMSCMSMSGSAIAF